MEQRKSSTAPSAAQVPLHFLANFCPISLESRRHFAQIWPKIAAVQFLANFRPILSGFWADFADIWPKFAGRQNVGMVTSFIAYICVCLPVAYLLAFQVAAKLLIFRPFHHVSLRFIGKLLASQVPLRFIGNCFVVLC
jgi:hypothetical protein